MSSAPTEAPGCGVTVTPTENGAFGGVVVDATAMVAPWFWERPGETPRKAMVIAVVSVSMVSSETCFSATPCSGVVMVSYYGLTRSAELRQPRAAVAARRRAGS